MQTPAILGSLRLPASAETTAPALFKATAGQLVEVTLEAIQPDGLALRLPDGRILQAKGSLPFPLGSLLTLKALPLPEGAGLRLQVMEATPPPGPAVLAPLVQGEAAQLLARLNAGDPQAGLASLLHQLVQGGAATAEAPESWARWLKEVLATLADQQASPMEATFHRLQAKEGTGWFEVPLPWAPGAEPLRIWIEGDHAASSPEGDAVHRVFLSVPFSSLGDVRLGLEQRQAGLKIRLWLQDPEAFEPHRAGLVTELTTLGRPVDLQVLRLPEGAQDLRSLAGAPPVQALG